MSRDSHKGVVSSRYPLLDKFSDMKFDLTTSN